ncbi:MAG TPA: hypothetical protein VHY84_13970 [Bryobacteraceae bacterium]|jgi:hypothetical protein|nr:hypothetical protein [Bryobacteraceae bacterium]
MSSFEKIANIAVILAAVAVVSTNIYDRFTPRVPVAQATLAQKFLGKRMPLPDSVLSGAKGTVTLFISKDCHFCTASMAFYQRLAALKSPDSCNIKLVALAPKDHDLPEEVETYLSGHNLSVDEIEVVDFANLGVTGTPTVVLHDGARRVQGLWVGLLSEARQAEVIAKVTSVCHG